MTLEWAERYQQWGQRDREDFARIANQLLAGTFLLRDQESSRRDYYFVERNEDVFAGYFRLIQWDLIVDRAYGVVQLTSRQGEAHLQLRLMDSVLLLILRLLYEERRKSLMITDQVICQVQDLHDKALALRLRDREVIEKKYLREAFSMFRRYSLVELVDEDVTDPECRFKIFPSILFAVRLEGLQEIQARLAAYAGRDSSEVADSNQAD